MFHDFFFFLHVVFEQTGKGRELRVLSKVTWQAFHKEGACISGRGGIVFVLVTAVVFIYFSVESFGIYASLI